MKYKQVIESLALSIAKYFDNVYHSVEIITLDDTKLPALVSDDEWLPLTPTDQRETVYIRTTGEDIVSEELRIGSCGKSYKMFSPLRIVFFRDHVTTPHDEILSKLMKASLVSFTRLRSITRDKWKVLKEETSIPYNLGASTVYIALDIYAVWQLVPDDCGEDFCITIDNPIKLCS